MQSAQWIAVKTWVAGPSVSVGDTATKETIIRLSPVYRLQPSPSLTRGPSSSFGHFFHARNRLDAVLYNRGPRLSPERRLSVDSAFTNLRRKRHRHTVHLVSVSMSLSTEGLQGSCCNERSRSEFIYIKSKHYTRRMGYKQANPNAKNQKHATANMEWADAYSTRQTCKKPLSSPTERFRSLWCL